MRARVCAEPTGFMEARSLITADTAAQWLRDAIRYENGYIINWIRDNYPSSAPTIQDLILMACLEGRPEILRRYSCMDHCQSVILAMLDVMRCQSPQRARRIFSAMMTAMTVEERCYLGTHIMLEGRISVDTVAR